MILNGKSDSFSEETKNRVLETVEEMNYKPNTLARSLITRKTKTIGLVLPDITNPFYPEVARAIEDVANSKGYSVMLCNTDNNLEKEKRYISVLKEKFVDGIIFTTDTSLNQDEFNELVGNTPTLILDENVEVNYKYGVFVDNIKGGYEAVKYLLGLGHKKIDWITGPLESKNSLDRMAEFRKILFERGIKLDENLIFEGDYKIESGIKAIEYFGNREYTAIFAFNDMMAFGVYKGLKSRGYDVPEDVSVVGFDDLDFAQILEPSLTTIKQPVYKIGKAAGELLIRIIEDKSCDDNIIVYEPKLIRRGSTKILRR